MHITRGLQTESQNPLDTLGRKSAILECARLRILRPIISKAKKVTFTSLPAKGYSTRLQKLIEKFREAVEVSLAQACISDVARLLRKARERE
jgi:hypothetical protein